jgi:hypothetical protein
MQSEKQSHDTDETAQRKRQSLVSTRLASAIADCHHHWKAIACTCALLIATTLVLYWEGRRWWCAVGDLWPVSMDAWGKHNSQHLFDPYSLTHVEHGILLCGIVLLVCPRLSQGWAFCLATALECLWEVIENSSFVIDRYRMTTAALGYTGDTITNALGDVVSCMLGYYLARCIGFWRSAWIVLITEVVLLIWIRDNLSLNILMLAWPIEAISTWQAGH